MDLEISCQTRRLSALRATFLSTLRSIYLVALRPTHLYVLTRFICEEPYIYVKFKNTLSLIILFKKKVQRAHEKVLVGIF